MNDGVETGDLTFFHKVDYIQHDVDVTSHWMVHILCRFPACVPFVSEGGGSLKYETKSAEQNTDL